MRYCLLLLLVLIQVSLSAQKMKEPGKKDPDGIKRLTEFVTITPNKTVILGIGGSKLNVSFRILETDSGTIQLNLSGEAGANRIDVRKGDPVIIFFTDSSRLVIPALKEGRSSGVKFNGVYEYDLSAYYELSKADQQQLINKEVESIVVKGFYHKKFELVASYIPDKTKRDMIGKALQLFD